MSRAVNPQREFWNGKHVLLTGHTGFKGAWLTLWLHSLGAHVTGISLPPATTPSLFRLNRIESLCESHYCDIREAKSLDDLIKSSRAEVLIHLAAQSLVRTSYRHPLETFATNVMGTAHVLDALRDLPTMRVAIVVTTDKVYANREWHWPYREDDELGGHDPYSASKAASEAVIASYRDSFLSSQGVAVASARAGNVIGGGDWSEDRLIPDAVRAWQHKKVLDIRRPNAVRPWQHVLEPLAGYLALAQKLWDQPALAGAYNFGPTTDEAATVREVVELARSAYAGSMVEYTNGTEGDHEAGRLALDISKARQVLGFTPRISVKEAIQLTMEWYTEQHSGTDAQFLCEKQIRYFVGLA